MKRGEIWWVALGPTGGGEIQKPRPAVIVSNNAANKYLNRVQVVPLTSSTRNLYPSEAWISVGGMRNKAMADIITTASKKRLARKIGTATPEEMEALERAIKTHLDLR